MKIKFKSIINVLIAFVLAIVESVLVTVISDSIKITKTKMLIISLPILIILYLIYYNFNLIKNYISVSKKCIVKLLESVFYRYRINEIEGFYGREDIIKELYAFHISSKKNKRILLSGYGGTGKTTIINNFKKKLKSRTKIVIYNDDLNISQIKSNTIVFCDYALENKKSISGFIKTINNSRKKHISFVIIERNFAIDYLELAINFDLTIDLSNEKYALSDDVLTKILKFNVEHDVKNNQYIDSEVNISNREATKLVDLIVKKIDPVLKRPIFSVIIADIYKENQTTDFSVIENVNILFDKYWSIITREKKIKEFLRSIKDDSEITDYNKLVIREICEQLKVETSFFELFSSMTMLLFNISYSDGGIQINIYDELLNNQTQNYYRIKEIMKPILSQNSHYNIKKHLMPLYSLNEFSVSNNSFNCIIKPIKFDIVAAWLFSKTMLDSNQINWLKDFLEVICTHYHELLHNIFSFAIRADDENYCMALMWFSENIINYKNYMFEDFNKDIRMCIQELISKKRNSKEKYKACKSILNNLYEAVKSSNFMTDYEKETLFEQSIRIIEQNDIEESISSEILDIIHKFSNKSTYVK